MNKSLTEYFAKKGYLLFCPKTHNFGGFHESFLWALKIKKYKEYKIIINFPLIPIHGHYKLFFKKNYGKKIIFNYLNTLSVREIILSLILSFLGNILILIVKLKFLFLFNLIFKKKFDKFIFPFLGIGLRRIEELDTYSNIEINNILETNINLGSREIIKNSKDKIISFCVKDNNYSIYKEISGYASANINNYKKSLIYLIDNGYKISRVGENTMNNFNFEHSSFKDLCRSKKHFEMLHNEIKNSEFYFGTGASHGVIPDLYGKKKILTNNIDFIQSCISSSYNNFGIFKKIFSVKQKKILSLEEIFFNDKLFLLKLNDLLKTKEVILVENSDDEILSLVKVFTNKDNNNEKISDLMSDYEELRRNAIIKHKQNNIKSFYISLYESSKITIPDDFLNNYLYNSDKLREISRKFIIDNKL